MVDARAFEAIARDAETLLGASDLDAEATRALVARAREATDAVPAARRDDWRTLLGGFDRDEPAERRLARLEGLIRACTAFRALAPGAPKPKPLCAEDSVAALAGLGPSTAKVLAEQGVRDVGDLVLSPPMAAIDLRAPASGEAVLAAALAPERRAIAVRGVVEKVSIVPMRGRRAIRVALRSGDVLVELWWFFMAAGARALSGEIVAIGTPSLSAGSSRKQGTVRIAHPRIVKAGGDDRIEPIYPFRGLPNAKVAQAIRDALGRLPLADLEPLPPALLGDAAPLASLLHDVHTPDAMEAHLAARDAVRARLATAEACWLVSRRLERERALSALRAPNLAVDPRGRAALVRAFGFTPTRAQERAIDAIGARLASDAPSRTLLTGDVGTGKTAVLLAAAAQAIAARSQVAIFAPTTLLADQYVEAAGPLARALKARVVLLPRASADRAGFQRVVALARAGEVDVVVGTHALLADEVSFSRLGLVVVDEQHRLGVAQRLGVVERGRAASASGEEALAPHLITVSATPIPRTLALALRGEIESVHLDERPRGRRTPATALLPRPRFGEALERIRAALAEGGRAYVVCANIDARTLDDGTPDALASPGAKARAAELAKALGDDVVALVHGAMDDDARRRALTAFRRGEARVLVGTSLLEVGIDVPEATLMVVDGADRFGLAQLHQLRGRVGRGERLGTCLLVHPEPLADVSRARLVALVEAREGLEVAKADLRLRGPGDLEGARQSGEASGFRFLDPLADEARIGAAYEAMRALLEENPTLEGPTLQGFRRVLARFDAIAATGDLGLAMGEAG